MKLFLRIESSGYARLVRNDHNKIPTAACLATKFENAAYKIKILLCMNVAIIYINYAISIQK